MFTPLTAIGEGGYTLEVRHDMHHCSWIFITISLKRIDQYCALLINNTRDSYLHYTTLHGSCSENKSDFLLVCISHPKHWRWKAFLVDRIREVLGLQAQRRVHGVAYWHRRGGRCGGEAHEVSRIELQPRLSGEELQHPTRRLPTQSKYIHIHITYSTCIALGLRERTGSYSSAAAGSSALLRSITKQWSTPGFPRPRKTSIQKHIQYKRHENIFSWQNRCHNNDDIHKSIIQLPLRKRFPLLPPLQLQRLPLLTLH